MCALKTIATATRADPRWVCVRLDTSDQDELRELVPESRRERRGRNPLFRAAFSPFAKTMRAKRGQLEDGGAELGA
jgi:hypothetical protein